MGESERASAGVTRTRMGEVVERLMLRMMKKKEKTLSDLFYL